MSRLIMEEIRQEDYDWRYYKRRRWKYSWSTCKRYTNIPKCLSTEKKSSFRCFASEYEIWSGICPITDIRFALPLLHVYMTKEECEVFDANRMSFRQKEKEFATKYVNEEGTKYWVMYNKDDGIIDVQKGSTLEGWLFLINRHPNDFTSLITIPGEFCIVPPAFNLPRIRSELVKNYEGPTIKPEKVKIKLSLKEDDEKMKEVDLVEEDKVKYFFKTGSHHCVIHEKNIPPKERESLQITEIASAELFHLFGQPWKKKKKKKKSFVGSTVSIPKKLWKTTKNVLSKETVPVMSPREIWYSKVLQSCSVTYGFCELELRNPRNDNHFETLTTRKGRSKFAFLLLTKYDRRPEMINKVILGHRGFIDRTTTFIIGRKFQTKTNQTKKLTGPRTNQILVLPQNEMIIPKDDSCFSSYITLKGAEGAKRVKGEELSDFFESSWCERACVSKWSRRCSSTSRYFRGKIECVKTGGGPFLRNSFVVDTGSPFCFASLTGIAFGQNMQNMCKALREPNWISRYSWYTRDGQTEWYSTINGFVEPSEVEVLEKWVEKGFSFTSKKKKKRVEELKECLMSMKEPQFGYSLNFNHSLIEFENGDGYITWRRNNEKIAEENVLCFLSSGLCFGQGEIGVLGMNFLERFVSVVVGGECKGKQLEFSESDDELWTRRCFGEKGPKSWMFLFKERSEFLEEVMKVVEEDRCRMERAWARGDEEERIGFVRKDLEKYCGEESAMKVVVESSCMSTRVWKTWLVA